MKVIEHLEGLFSSKLEIARGILTLFKLEAKLAGMNIFPLIISLCVLIAVVLSFWLTLMILIGYLIVILSKQNLIAIISVLAINLVLTLFILKNLKDRLDQMSFKHTRRCLEKPQMSDNL